MYRISHFGFTLAELLIALAILGVIAVFTIPKVLQNQQNQRYKAMAKEVAGTLAQACQKHAFNGSLNGNTFTADLTQYMNYTLTDTSSFPDSFPGGGTDDCTNTDAVCLKLHNGGTLWMDKNSSFGGTATTNLLFYRFDPDGKGDGTVKAVEFFLYYNGKVRTWATAEPNSICSNCGPVDPVPGREATWFDWN